MIKIVKYDAPWAYVMEDRNGEEITGTFLGRELEKANPT